MARMPGARWLGEHSPRRPIERYDRIILHTIVGRAPVHTPHFSVAGDGTIYQSRDTKYQSAVSLEGNPTSIGIEAEDMGPLFSKWDTKDGHAVPGYTDAQVEAIARICSWAHKTHGIPLDLCPNSKPGSRGLAYHRQGIDGNFGSYAYPGRVPGGEIWSKTFGKVCPGDRRIAARPRIIIRAREIAGLQKEENDMPTLDEMRDLFRSELARYGNQQIGQYITGVPITRWNSAGPARYGHLDWRDNRRDHAEIMEMLAGIAKAVGPMSDEERKRLVNDLAEKVNQARIRVELVQEEPGAE